MSYNGWRQLICENGHYYTMRAVDIDYDENGPCVIPADCPVCNAHAVWYNEVDVTNGSYCINRHNDRCKDCDLYGSQLCNNGRIDGFIELEESSEDEIFLCSKCGSMHMTNPPTFKIPKEGGYRIS
jgi:hypothetical protein